MEAQLPDICAEPPFVPRVFSTGFRSGERGKMAPAPRGVREERLLECRSRPPSRLLTFAPVLLLLLLPPAARAGLCPSLCSCRTPVLDCSRRKLPAASWRALSNLLPPDTTSL